jgi:hypothetical protein
MAKKEEETILDTIQALQRRDPFDPFRIVISSGDKYLVENPHNLAIGESLLSYFYPHSDRFVFIRINQLVAIERFVEKPAA